MKTAFVLKRNPIPALFTSLACLTLATASTLAQDAAPPAKAGYPSVQVPAGMVSGTSMGETPDYPFGATFTGRAFSEPTLLRIAYAFEQASKARRKPPGVPPLQPGCGPS